jgi:hypothetical protein
MPALEFPQFLRRYALQLLAVANTDVMPGEVVDNGRRGFLPQGHLQEILGERTKGFWDTEMNLANLVYGSVERTISLDGTASLNEMGVQIGGGLKAARSVSFSITGVHARTFLNGTGHASMFTLMPLVHALKKGDRRNWKMVNGKWIVTETYYATEATVSFATSGSVDVKAQVEEAGGVHVGGSAAVQWTSKKSFTITQNDGVPFGFRGWKV